MKFICPLTPSGIGFYLLSLPETKLIMGESCDNRVNNSISQREEQIVELLSHGLSEKEIADKLFLSARTVGNHLTNIRQKLGVNKNIEIVAYHLARLRGKPFDVKLLREYGISIFIILVNVCEMNHTDW